MKLILESSNLGNAGFAIPKIFVQHAKYSDGDYIKKFEATVCHHPS